MKVAAVLLAILFILFILLAVRSVRIAKEYQRVVVFRLGRCVGARGPGMIWINPIVDRTNWVDLRERYLEIPNQRAITKDNAPITIDFIVFYKVLDPVTSVLAVQDFASAAINIAATTLRSLVGDVVLDDVLVMGTGMTSLLQAKLDELTERWGVKVTNVEVRGITPPPNVQDAMTQQMSAERRRRAAVTDAEGERAAAIAVAEGQKQASILAAEGERQATILAAEAAKAATILAAEAEKLAAGLRAAGEADALRNVNQVARDLDPATVTLRYLATLGKIGESESSKVVLPAEFVSVGANLLGLLNASSPSGATGLRAAQAAPSSNGSAPGDRS
jgi:regulator of protease activity HflC (stomatin/prohibitin superfamily)